MDHNKQLAISKISFELLLHSIVFIRKGIYSFEMASYQSIEKGFKWLAWEQSEED